MEKCLSICIPAYNRPAELLRLLRSIDSVMYRDRIEVVIREDQSPKREEIRASVKSFQTESSLEVRYTENPENYGYDKNLRTLAGSAQGRYVLIMGDDDVFCPGALDPYLSFIEEHSDIGYILRRYRAQYADGTVEDYRYAKQNVFFEPGEDSYVELFRRSLFISGFTFRKADFNDFGQKAFDGTLLFQLYIEATVCLNRRAAYCDIPLTMSIEGGIPYFGSSKNEQALYTSGSNTVGNSINFMKQVIYTSEQIDRIFQIKCSRRIVESYSRYSYGFLLEHRQEGIRVFTRYARELRELGFGCTLYFYLYYLMLLFLGRKGTRKLIVFVKKLWGRTPRL
ncbi:glycosyltransferase family 2 protein [Lachnoclostridium sp. Marseille-P6806]|uniref:glycosyltransferase family 2 protein n=1 Tax=Lachnoclostridium sp. Marseille-P6806 TaxID=2364793 RepID=UPI00102F468D|nr:glycosyltransferase family 2 protein [Lachnoclostridium sp. Marseille-P6806]